MGSLKVNKKLTEQEIDALVIAEADDDSAWEAEEFVEHPKAISLRLDTSLIRKLKMLSKLHGKRGYQTLVKDWISEKVTQEFNMIREVKAKIDTLDWEEISN